MKVVWGNSFDSSNNSYNYRTYEKKAMERSSGSNQITGGAVFGKEEMHALKAEQRLREAEDKMLEQYRVQIAEIEGSDDDDKTKKIKISVVTEQIKQIEEARAQREQDAMLRELEKKKAEAESQKKKAEEQAAEREDPEEAEAAIKRQDIEGMVKLSVSHESIKELSRTKSILKSEAKQLEIDIDNDFGVMKYGRVSTGHTTPNDFKHRQLNKLNKGISGLDASMASEIRKLAEEASEFSKAKASDAAETEQEDEKRAESMGDRENIDISL